MIDPIILQNWRHPKNGIVVPAAFVFFGEIQISMNQKFVRTRVDIWPSVDAFMGAVGKKTPGVVDVEGLFFDASFEVNDNEDLVAKPFTSGLERVLDMEISIDAYLLEQCSLRLFIPDAEGVERNIITGLTREETAQAGA
jgi:hypothetical protein